MPRKIPTKKTCSSNLVVLFQLNLRVKARRPAGHYTAKYRLRRMENTSKLVPQFYQQQIKQEKIFSYSLTFTEQNDSIALKVMQIETLQSVLPRAKQKCWYNIQPMSITYSRTECLLRSKFNWKLNSQSLYKLYKLLNQLFALVSFCSKNFYTFKTFLHLLKH